MGDRFGTGAAASRLAACTLLAATLGFGLLLGSSASAAAEPGLERVPAASAGGESAKGVAARKCRRKCRTRRLLNDTHYLATNYIRGAYDACNYTFYPCVNGYEVNRAGCAKTDYNQGRCTVVFSQWEYGSGYGYGGYDMSVWRESFFATRIGFAANGSRLYQTRIVQIDFIDPWYWICSDTPRYNVPPCYGNYYRGREPSRSAGRAVPNPPS